MKIYVQTNKATTNIFGLHTQPRKTTRFPNILKLVWGGMGGGVGGGGRKKSPFIKWVMRKFRKASVRPNLFLNLSSNCKKIPLSSPPNVCPFAHLQTP